MRITCTVAVALTLMLPSITLESQPVTSLVGVWKVAEIVSPQGQRNSSPQPTLYLFTARHYSHVSVTFTGPGTFTTFEVTIEGANIWILATNADAGPIPADSANRVRLVRLV